VRSSLENFAPCFFEHLPQFAEILDDAVVNHGDVVGRMRMGVGLIRLAMGGPAGMADAGMTGERFGVQSRFVGFSTCLRRGAAREVAFQRGDPAGIVTAVFEAFERIHNLIRDRTRARECRQCRTCGSISPDRRKIFEKRRTQLLTRIAGVEILNNYCGLRQG